MPRPTATLIVVGALALCAGVVASRWPSAAPVLTCPPEEVHLDARGVAHCGPGAPLSAAQALAVGQPLDLGSVAEVDLALVPGLGRAAAAAVIAARTDAGAFTSWAQVDAVPGVGPARLEALRRHTRLGGDAGVW